MSNTGPTGRDPTSAGDDGVASIRFLGIRIDSLRLPQLLELVSAAVRTGRPTILQYVNVHSMNVAAHDARYAETLEKADFVYCDGTGVRIGARLAGLIVPQRMTGADWVHDLCRLAVREQISLYLLGGEVGIARQAAILLTVRYPGLQIAGTAGGFDLGPHTIDAINRASPDVLLVGLGTPTQEFWIHRHRSELDVPVVWAVGALFAFVSGRVWRGPRLMTEHGFEWVCRLAAEPRKLWRRYLIGNPQFLLRVVRYYWF